MARPPVGDIVSPRKINGQGTLDWRITGIVIV
jgi:hypothetical protein